MTFTLDASDLAFYTAGGVGEASLGRLQAPIGLELNAETPEEIALSIVGQIVMDRRGGDGAPMSDSPVAEGVETPLIAWVPSMTPSGLVFYTGDKFPRWKGNCKNCSIRTSDS